MSLSRLHSVSKTLIRLTLHGPLEHFLFQLGDMSLCGPQPLQPGHEVICYHIHLGHIVEHLLGPQHLTIDSNAMSVPLVPLTTNVLNFKMLKGIARLSFLQNWMLKTPLYWIAAFNFTCSQLSLICIQCVQHTKIVSYLSAKTWRR